MICSMKNVLITCAGGAGSLYLAKSLQPAYQVFLADANDQIAAADAGLPFRKIPFGAGPSFGAALRALIREWDLDIIVPGTDEELLPCDALRQEGICACVLPQHDFMKLCLHKKRLMRSLQEKGISNLLPFETEESVSYPAFAKPIFGRGSRQAHQLDSPEQLRGYLQLYRRSFPDVLVQPYVDGTEYTVSVIVNNRNAILGIVPKRIIEKCGITLSAITEKSDVISHCCDQVVRELEPCGPFNVQLKIRDGIPYIFEINPRLSTTAVLTEKAFGNEIDLYIRYYDQRKPLGLPTLLEGVRLIRHYAHLFTNSLE